jgi:tight adherence protein C
MLLAIAISVFLFFFLAGLISFMGYRIYARPTRFQKRLGSLEENAQPSVTLDPSGAPDTSWLVRVVQTIGEKVPISPQEASLTRRTLLAAGFRSDRAIKIHYGVKLIAAGVFFIGAVIASTHIANPILRILVLPAGALGGFFLPNLGLDLLVSRRQERIRFALPDALDLMVVCMEAGLGLDQAIASVSRELLTTHRDLSEELGLVTLEMRAGKRRVDALKNLADRTGESELRKLVATMVQADRFGTSVAESLRTHSDFMRVKRRQAAEERAAKVGVKLVFPIFLFIMPAMMLVAAGPGLLQLMKGLFPLMRGAGGG